MKRIENVLKRKEWQELNALLNTHSFPWYYMNTTAYDYEQPTPWGFSFFHMLLDKGHPVSNYWISFRSIVEFLAKMSGVQNSYIGRVRLGLITRTPKTIIHTPHVDFEVPHTTLLYYINKSDGNTLFYNNNKVIHENEYKHNSMMIFDGAISHSSTTPIKHDTRIALNINLFPND